MNVDLLCILLKVSYISLDADYTLYSVFIKSQLYQSRIRLHFLLCILLKVSYISLEADYTFYFVFIKSQLYQSRSRLHLLLCILLKVSYISLEADYTFYSSTYVCLFTAILYSIYKFQGIMYTTHTCQLEIACILRP